jgi:hypothetical protein
MGDEIDLSPRIWAWVVEEETVLEDNYALQ